MEVADQGFVVSEQSGFDALFGESLDGETQEFVRHSEAPKVRTYRQFAEAEIVLPNGPKKGRHFDVDFMPFTGLLLDMFDSGAYRRFFASGNVQGGKTLMLLAIPVMYSLFEMIEDVILGVPMMDLAQGIYQERLLPIIQSSRFRNQLPTSGSGSRGGKTSTVRFRNGTLLRFMAAGGSDAAMSSHTSRIICLTEIDKMDQPGATSREGDPLQQIEARSAAFGLQARVFSECTMSTAYGRINTEITKFGTDTKVVIPCAHCGHYVYPEREYFTGWQDADSQEEAEQAAGYVCQECGVIWTEADRAESLNSPMLVSRGQEIKKKRGKFVLVGDAPKTSTFGVRWNAMHSPLVPMASIAEREWRAAHSDNPNDMKPIHQFIWTLPFDEKLTDLSALTRAIILTKITKTPHGIVPDTADKVVVFIDVGLYQCWWGAIASGPDGRPHIVDYGCIDVGQGRETAKSAILSALRAFREDTIEHGWAKADGTVMPVDLTLIDSGYEPGIVYEFVLEGTQPRYLAAKGLGTARNELAWKKPKEHKDRQIGDEWVMSRMAPPNRDIILVELHSDYWKRLVHAGLAAPAAAKGSIMLYAADEKTHLTYCKQVLAEREEEQFVPGIGPRIYWNQLHRSNHYLDVTYGCLCGLNIVDAIRGVQAAPPPPAPKAANAASAPISEGSGYAQAKDKAMWKIGR